MNQLAHPIAPAFEDDEYGWALARADALRARRTDQIDWDRLAEKMDDMARSQYDALESSLRVLLIRILEWTYQPSHGSRSWLAGIREQHRQFDRRLVRNPGPKSSLEGIRVEAYRQARVSAANETGLALESFPADPPGLNVINNPPPLDGDPAFD